MSERENGMNQARSDEPRRDDVSAEPRSYEPPRIAWEEDWDVRANLASACAKQSGTSLECNADPTS